MAKQPKRKAWHIVLEVILSIAFFGACMYGWYVFRPRVISAFYPKEYPT